MDGSYDVCTGVAGVGAILRDSPGTFYGAVAANIGYNSNVTAELWAIRKGLELLHHFNIFDIHIQTDSLVIFHLIHNPQEAHSSYPPPKHSPTYPQEDRKPYARKAYFCVPGS